MNYLFSKFFEKIEFLEKNVRKGEIAHYEQFLLFPQCFQKLSCVDVSK